MGACTPEGLSPSPPGGLQREDPGRGHPLGHPGKVFLRNWIEVRQQWNRDRGTFLMIEIIMSRGFEEGKVCVCVHARICMFVSMCECSGESVPLRVCGCVK